MELETAPSFFPSLQIYKGTSPVCNEGAAPPAEEDSTVGDVPLPLPRAPPLPHRPEPPQSALPGAGGAGAGGAGAGGGHLA